MSRENHRETMLDPEQDTLYSLALEFQRLHASNGTRSALRRCWSNLLQHYTIRYEGDPGSLHNCWIGDYLPSFRENQNEMEDIEGILRFVGALTKHFYDKTKTTYGGA